MLKTYTKDQLSGMNKDEMIDLFLQQQKQLLLFDERIAAMTANRFGSKSETLQCLGQQDLFNEVEMTADPNEAEPVIETITVTRKKVKGKRAVDLSRFPCRIVKHEKTTEELESIFGKGGWKQLNDVVYSKLLYHPATQEVEEHHIAVYAGKKNRTIVKAEHPVEMIGNSIATPSLVAAILNGKYTNAMPLNRIEQEFKRNDVNLSRQTISNWVLSCAENYLSVMYEYLRQLLVQATVLQADETPVKVVEDPGAKSWMHIYHSGEYERTKRIVLYRYSASRGHEVAEEFLKGFKGYLETDAFSGYNALAKRNTDILPCFCWAHARRSYADAVKAAKKNAMPESTIQSSVAAKALGMIAKIYYEDNKWKEASAQERYNHRQTVVKPLVEAYFAWVKSVDPGSVLSDLTRKGLQYSLNQERELRRFLENGDIPIDNSASERSIRPFTVGRANWHMTISSEGARASAIAYSIAECAKANNLKPYEYFRVLLEEIPPHVLRKDLYGEGSEYLQDLLPWSDRIQKLCGNKPIAPLVK